MKLIFFLFAASALFTTAAVPVLPSGSLNVPSLPPNRVPKIDIGQRAMTKNDRTAARAVMIDHYMALKPENEQKQSRLVFATKWRDGNGPDDEHRQYLDFDYHRGDTPYSEKIGQTVTIVRDRPPPESHFSSTVAPENKAELAQAMEKKYNALPPDVAKRVRSMKAHTDWGDGPGLREESQMTFHYNPIPLAKNKLGNPVTIYRPMSFLIHDSVPPKDVPSIKRRIRQEHEGLDDNDPLKQANYGAVSEGWFKETKKPRRVRVGAMLYKVKDQLSDSAEEDFARVDNLHVTFRPGLYGSTIGPNAASIIDSSSDPTEQMRS